MIAIENARLFEAEQQRTRELTESLEQQTATSEVLQVISSSPGDLQPVFETMLQNAVRICDAKFGNIFRWDGEASAPPCGAQYAASLRGISRRRSPMFDPSPDAVRRMVETKTTIHFADLRQTRLTLNAIRHCCSRRTWGRTDDPSRSDAQGKRVDRRVRHSFARKFVPLPTSRSSW